MPPGRRCRPRCTRVPYVACLALLTAPAPQLAIAVPIFSYLIGIAAALFASWYTYGLAGCFWLYDTYHLRGGMATFRKRPFATALAVFTVLTGAFICVAGTYVFIKVIYSLISAVQTWR